MSDTMKDKKLPEALEASSEVGSDSSKKHAVKDPTKQEDTFALNMDRKRPFKSISDERDEQGHSQVTEKHKNQTRAPPSPAKPATISAHPGAPDEANAFDWMGGRFHLTENEKIDTSKGTPMSKGCQELKYRNSPAHQRGDHRQNGHHDESSFLLFGHSFDTLSESGDYLAHTEHYDERAPPSPHTLPRTDNPTTPRIEIALPELGHCDSDCSMADVSPIKVANRHLPAIMTPAGAADSFHHSLANSGQLFPPHHPPHQIAQTGGTHVQFGGVRSSNPQPTGIQPAPPRYDGGYQWRQHHGYPMERDDHVSNPFYVIRSSQRAFAGCTYLLPCLREDMISVNLNRYGHIQRYQGNPEKLDAGSMELVIATRRIETAICHFGGTLNPRRPSHTSSIFRLKEDRSSNKFHYEQQLPQRYQVTEGRISWEVEANPPVNIEQAPPNQKQSGKRGQSRNDGSTKRAPHVISDDTPGGKRAGAANQNDAAAENEKKMKYRCKLCGQPKQNHTCMFRSSLQRNIGVQIYSAVNAYTACEPGTLAPSLSKMNNFASFDSSGGHGSHHAATPEGGYPPVRSHNAVSHCHPSTVTPQTIREGGAELHSPQSSLSTHSQEMSPHVAPPSASRSGSSTDNPAPGNGNYHVHFSHRAAVPGDKKRSRALVMEGHPRPYHNTFAPSVALRPEHYRAVTPFRNNETANPDAYKYATIPVSFAERKRLSDTLFYFSRKMPNVTRDCGAVLREAREVGDWDQAVAELLTQVVVGLYCGEGDVRLDGLQQFLLNLGVSC